MNEGGCEMVAPEPESELGLFARRMELHLTDLEMFRDEIRKVQELLFETLNSGEEAQKEKNIGEATARLENRLHRWIPQIIDEYRAIRIEMLRQTESGQRASQCRPTPSAQGCDIFLVDDRTLVRSGLKRILESRPGYRVVGEASAINGIGALPKRTSLDLVIAHVPAEKSNELRHVVTIKRRRPSLKVLVLAGRTDLEFLARLVHAGVDASLLDDSDDDELFRVVEAVLAREERFSPVLSENLIDGLRKAKSEVAKSCLTRREKEVLKLIVQGKSSRTIAERLLISVHTVDRHRANMMAKLNVKKATDLVKYAFSQGLTAFDGGG
jgi:DNA-binding NarL/FixJ family response regulator